MRRLLFFIVITAMGMFKGHSQALVQTYTDRCTGVTSVFTVPTNGQIVVTFYNKSRTFPAAQFTNGELQGWLEATYLWWNSLSPCSTTTTGATATQQTTQQTTQQATQAATNATANVAAPPTTNTTTNAPPTTSSPPSTTETSTPPPADTSATSNNTSTSDTSTAGADTSSQGTNETSTGGSEASQTDTQSSSDQTDTSSTETTESTNETTESTSTEDTSTEDSSTETSSEDTSESSTEESTEEVDTEETTEESTEESTEEESENQESDEESSEDESDESSEEESEEEGDEEESESDEDEESEEEDSEEESDDEESEEGGQKKKKKRNLTPPVVMANMLSQQGPDGRYTQAAMFGVSQSSLLGTETYGLNAMVYSNLQQLMLTANYSKVHIKIPDVSELNHDTHKHYKEGKEVDKDDPQTPPQPRVNRVYSGSIGMMKMFSTYVAMMNHSMVWLGQKGTVAGLALGTTLTSVELDVRKGIIYYDTQILGASLTGFATKPYRFDRLTVSPMLAISSPFVNYDLYYHSLIWNKDVMIIGGSSFTYSLTQRFGLNLGVNIIESTIKDFPTLKTFTIGGRLSF